MIIPALFLSFFPRKGPSLKLLKALKRSDYAFLKYGLPFLYASTSFSAGCFFPFAASFFFRFSAILLNNFFNTFLKGPFCTAALVAVRIFGIGCPDCDPTKFYLSNFQYFHSVYCSLFFSPIVNNLRILYPQTAFFS